MTNSRLVLDIIGDIESQLPELPARHMQLIRRIVDTHIIQNRHTNREEMTGILVNILCANVLSLPGVLTRARQWLLAYGCLSPDQIEKLR